MVTTTLESGFHVATKEHEFEQDHISRAQVVLIRMDLTNLAKDFSGKTVADLNVANLADVPPGL